MCSLASKLNFYTDILCSIFEHVYGRSSLTCSGFSKIIKITRREGRRYKPLFTLTALLCFVSNRLSDEMKYVSQKRIRLKSQQYVIRMEESN